MSRLPVKIDPNKKTRMADLRPCDPVDDSCTHPPYQPPFQTGIAVKHSPSCTGDICGLFQCDGGNWRVTSNGTLDRSEWLKGWAITQLFTRGFVDCDEHPLRQRGGGWWADAFRVSEGTARFRSGSKLWAIKFASLHQALLLARAYTVEALQPLITYGIATAIDVDSFFVSYGPVINRASGVIESPGAIIQVNIAIRGPGITSEFTIEGRNQPNSIWVWQEYQKPRPDMSHGHYYARAAPPRLAPPQG